MMMMSMMRMMRITKVKEFRCFLCWIKMLKIVADFYDEYRLSWGIFFYISSSWNICLKSDTHIDRNQFGHDIYFKTFLARTKARNDINDDKYSMNMQPKVLHWLFLFSIVFNSGELFVLDHICPSTFQLSINSYAAFHFSF